jgi:hypothetical protein
VSREAGRARLDEVRRRRRRREGDLVVLEVVTDIGHALERGQILGLRAEAGGDACGKLRLAQDASDG